MQDEVEEMKKEEEFSNEEPVFKIIPPIAEVEQKVEPVPQQNQDETLAFLIKKGDESYKNQKYEEKNVCERLKGFVLSRRKTPFKPLLLRGICLTRHAFQSKLVTGFCLQ